MASKGPAMYDVQSLIQAGIDPKTGLPLKVANAMFSASKADIKKLLRIKDEQQAIRRYVWYNLPSGLNGELIERILYYRYKGAFFYMPVVDKFYFLPYALDGEIDVYGRYLGITPLPFNGKSEVDDKGKPKAWITGLTKTPVYSLSELFDEDLSEKQVNDILADGAVLLCDYAKQISQTDLSRQQLNEAIIDIEAEMIPYMNTALLNSTGTTAVRVNNQDEQSNVAALNGQVKNAALNGERFLPVVGAVEFQELADSATKTGEPASIFMQAMESIDNFRLGTMGINNGGLFQKQAHMLQTEQNMASGADSFCLDDGLIQRQTFCDIVNAIWGLGIWCELSENVVGDMNMDGQVADGANDQGAQDGAANGGESNNESQ